MKGYSMTLRNSPLHKRGIVKNKMKINTEIREEKEVE
jgi:hypothetical protein